MSGECWRTRPSSGRGASRSRERRRAVSRRPAITAFRSTTLSSWRLRRPGRGSIPALLRSGRGPSPAAGRPRRSGPRRLQAGADRPVAGGGPSIETVVGGATPPGHVAVAVTGDDLGRGVVDAEATAGGQGGIETGLGRLGETGMLGTASRRLGPRGAAPGCPSLGP